MHFHHYIFIQLFFLKGVIFAKEWNFLGISRLVLCFVLYTQFVLEKWYLNILRSFWSLEIKTYKLLFLNVISFVGFQMKHQLLLGLNMWKIIVADSTHLKLFIFLFFVSNLISVFYCETFLVSKMPFLEGIYIFNIYCF